MKKLLLALFLLPSLTWAQYSPSRAIDDAARLKDVFSRKTPKKERQETPAEPSKLETRVQYETVSVVDSSDTANELRKQLASSQQRQESYQSEISKQDTELKNLRLLVLQRAQEIESLKLTLNQLRDVIDKVNEQTVNSQPMPSTAQLVVNMGEMAVIGGTSIRKATNGTVSVRSGSSHRTYTPRSSYTPKSSQYYTRGPRGGCYYLTSSGRKQYVDRDLCN